MNCLVSSDHGARERSEEVAPGTHYIKSLFRQKYIFAVTGISDFAVSLELDGGSRDRCLRLSGHGGPSVIIDGKRYLTSFLE